MAYVPVLKLLNNKMIQYTAFLHDGNLGDILASIPAMNEYYRKVGSKIILYLTNGQRGTYYPGAVHPTKNEAGEMVMLNETGIRLITPLLKAQSCIHDVKIHNGEFIHLDLNKIRETYVGMPNLSINRWYFYIHPDLACDLSQKWLTIPDAGKDFAIGKILITRSERYTNNTISYSFLKKYQKNMLFAGLPHERDLLCNEFGLDIEMLKISDFLELAQAIKQCRFHICNQTAAFQISEGLKHPRILEVCGWAANVIPIGEDAFDFLAQFGLEYNVDYLYKKTMQ